MRQHRPVRLIFEGTGSRGDVAPLLALAATLARRGYACQVLSNSGYEAEAKQAGIEFHAIADRNVAFSRGERVPLGEYLFAGLPAVARWMTAANARDHAVINLTRLSASNLFCERRGIATVRLSLSPRLRALATQVSDGLARAADRVETAIRSRAPRDIASSGKEQPPSLGIGHTYAGETA